MDGSTVTYVTPTAQQPVSSGSSAGAWALALVIIVIIFIIILVIVFYWNRGTIASTARSWTKVEGGTTSGEAFVASPDSVYLANNSAPASMQVVINQFPAITSVVTGNQVAEFQISNTSRGNLLNIAVASGLLTVVPASGGPDFGVIAPGQTATYLWVNSTTLQRLM